MNLFQLSAEFRNWKAELSQIPSRTEIGGVDVFYPKYTSPPKQGGYSLWGYSAYLFLRRQIKRLHAQRGFELVHAHYPSPCGVIAMLAKGWMRVPVVLSVHGADVRYAAEQHRLGAKVTRHVLRSVDSIIVHSSWTKRQVVEYGGDPTRIYMVPLGGDAPLEVGSGTPNNDGQEKRIRTLLSVGYLERRKGHWYVILALRRLLDMGYSLEYVIVGDGPEQKRLARLVQDLNLMHAVRFEGIKRHEEVWPYYTECDIFVLPSWDEAFGVVYVEALGLGRVAIGCIGQGGPEDLKRLGDCIELVKPRDVDSLVHALKLLLDNPDRRTRMGEIGQTLVRSKYTWKRNALGTAAIYRDLISRRAVDDEKGRMSQRISANVSVTHGEAGQLGPGAIGDG